MMNRRLYFLLPDVSHTLQAIAALRNADIGMRLHIKAGKGVDRGLLPSELQDINRDTGHWLEGIWWNTNLLVFFIALLVLVVALFMQWQLLAVLMAGIMLVTFLTGLLSTSLPDVKLSGFDHALSHHEILLIADTHRDQVRAVEKLVRSHHSGAVMGGASWHLGMI